MQNDEVDARLRLEGEKARQYYRLKRFYGMDMDTEFLRLLVTQDYNRLKEKLPKTELEDINVFDDHALIGTTDRTDLACIFFRNGKPWCDKDNSTTCRHAAFALTVPLIIEKLKARGWKNSSKLTSRG